MDKKKYSMNRQEAVKRLLIMARKSPSREDVEAIAIGVRAIVKRHINSCKNLAARKERRVKDESGIHIPDGDDCT